MTKAETYFNEVTATIADGTPGKMFGALCIKMLNGKAAAMFKNDCIIVKLEGDVQEEALALKGVQMFTPMEGRPMNGWVQLPFTQKGKWKHYLDISVDAVMKIPAKEAKKKK